ncbi:MAG: hypothetical protein ACOZQL_33235 [Myxococcota bacterium]
MTTDLEQRIAPLVNRRGLDFAAVDPSRPCGARMKGFGLVHLLDVMDGRDPRLAAMWRETLPLPLRAGTERRAVTSIAWIPIELYFHGIEWLARRDGGPRKALALGHAIASADIGAFFRFIFAAASPAMVLGLSGRFWKSYFDQSALKILSSTPTSCVAEISGWPLADECSLHELAGSLVAWMEASRARNARLTRFELVDRDRLQLDAAWN